MADEPVMTESHDISGLLEAARTKLEALTPQVQKEITQKLTSSEIPSHITGNLDASASDQENQKDPGAENQCFETLWKAQKAVLEALLQAQANLVQADTEEKLKQARTDLRTAKEYLKKINEAPRLYGPRALSLRKDCAEQAREEQKVSTTADPPSLLHRSAQVEEELEEATEELQRLENKANRLWYDIHQWSWAELKGRFFSFNYATLCAIGIVASLMALSLSFLSTWEGAILAACVTFFVNFDGFWDNVPRLFEHHRSSKLKTNYLIGYRLFAGLCILTAAFLMTSINLGGMLDLTEGVSYWATFAATIYFGMTVFAMQGLFTQEPRKWFAHASEHGIGGSLKAFGEQMLYGPSPTDKTLTLTTLLGAFSRVSLFLVFGAITMYATYIAADFASETFIGIFEEFFQHTSEANWAQDTHLSSIAPYLAGLFLIGRGSYNISLSHKLAMLTTELLENCGSAWKKETNALQALLGFSPIITKCLTVIPIIPVIALIPLAIGGIKILWQKEKNCWSEAWNYAQTQNELKGSYFFLPHFLARGFYNHMVIEGGINAYNNGALSKYAKFKGEIDRDDMTEKQEFKEDLAGVSGFTGSFGFNRLASGTRAAAAMNDNKYMSLDTDNEDNVVELLSFQYRQKEKQGEYTSVMEYTKRKSLPA